MTPIKTIQNDKDNQEALKQLRQLLKKGKDLTPAQNKQLEDLITLIEAYESERYPFELPTAVEAIEFRMDQMDMKPADLIPYIGSLEQVSAILAGKKKLTEPMIQALESNLGVPIEALRNQEANLEPADESPSTKNNQA